MLDSGILDLGGAIWGQLHQHFDIQQDEYACLVDNVHDAPPEFAPVINAHGFIWVRLYEQTLGPRRLMRDAAPRRTSSDRHTRHLTPCGCG